MNVTEIVATMIDRVKQYFNSPCLRWEIMTDLRDVDPPMIFELRQVYLSLCCVLWSSFLGSVVYFCFCTNVGGLMSLVGSILFIGCTWGFRYLNHWEERRRLSLLIAASFFRGVSGEFLIGSFISVNHAFMINALGGAAVTFSCFTMASFCCNINRGYTYIWGTLNSLVLVALWFWTVPSLFIKEYKFKPCFFALYMVGCLFLLLYIVVFSQETFERIRSAGGGFYANELYAHYESS